MGMKLSIAAKFDEENLRAARIVAADPVRYPGLMQEWADMILSRAAAPPADWEAGPLFVPYQSHERRRAA
jgi:hypothetical protein